MSLEERNSPSIDFNNNFLEKGEKKIKNRLDKHLKTPLERIQSISKELKLAEKQNNEQKKKERKFSKIWDRKLIKPKKIKKYQPDNGDDNFVIMDDQYEEGVEKYHELTKEQKEENERIKKKISDGNPPKNSNLYEKNNEKIKSSNLKNPTNIYSKFSNK